MYRDAPTLIELSVKLKTLSHDFTVRRHDPAYVGAGVVALHREIEESMTRLRDFNVGLGMKGLPATAVGRIHDDGSTIRLWFANEFGDEIVKSGPEMSPVAVTR